MTRRTPVRPQDEVELAVAQSFIMARWRQRRAWDFEAMKMNSEIAGDPELSPPLAALKAWDSLAENSPSFRLLHRYERGHRRDISKSLYDLYFCRNFLPPALPDPGFTPPLPIDQTNLSSPKSPPTQSDPAPAGVPAGFEFPAPKAAAAGASAVHPPSASAGPPAFESWPSLHLVPPPSSNVGRVSPVRKIWFPLLSLAILLFAGVLSAQPARQSAVPRNVRRDSKIGQVNFMLTRVHLWPVAFLLFAQLLPGELLEKTKKVAGTTVHYKVVLPSGYDAAKTYPAILAFGGGPQNMNTVDSVLSRNLRAEAEKRGYIVVAPAAPDDRLFFEGGDRIFPEFLKSILADYKIRDNKFHIAGPSNGGIAAFHVAAANPDYFLSVTAFPGYMWQPGTARLQAISKLCVFMYVGENDEYRWHDEMKQEAETLRSWGDVARYTVEKGQPHRMETLAGAGAARLFDGFEEAQKGCRIGK